MYFSSYGRGLSGSESKNEGRLSPVWPDYAELSSDRYLIRRDSINIGGIAGKSRCADRFRQKHGKFLYGGL